MASRQNRNQTHRAEERGSQTAAAPVHQSVAPGRGPWIAVAQRPVTLCIPADLRIEDGRASRSKKLESLSPTTTAFIYLDRGVNFLAARLPVWQFADEHNFSGAFVKDAYATEFVGVEHTIASIAGHVDPSTGRKRPAPMERDLKAVFDWLRDHGRTQRMHFERLPTQRLPTVVLCQLGAHLRPLHGAGYLEKAAGFLGSANATRGNAFRHLGALHDWAMLQDPPDVNIVEACRQRRERFIPTAA